MTTNGSAEANYIVPLLIDGKEVTTSTTFNVTSPGTGEKVWQSSSASKEDALSAIETAEKASFAWTKTKPAERRTILLKAADLLEKRRDESFKYISDETGALEGFFGFIFDASVEMLRDVAGRIAGALQGEIPTCGQEGTSALLLKEPYGVVLSIAPWNAPYVLGMRSIVYPIAAGNTVVFKGSELSPRCFWVLGKVLTDAGLPPGVLNIIYHRPQDAAEITQTIIEHRAVKKINFTGSTAVGSIIAGLAGKNLKPVLMELGGKASAIVCDDANVETAARECALGSFLHTGQICMSTERILVQSSILPAFREAIQKTISAIFPASNPGVTVMAAAVEKNKRLVADAVSKGAKVIHGDPNIEESTKTRMAPIVVEGVKKDMDLYYMESFGPSVSLIPFETEEQAIEIANDTDYGLSGAVFTENLARGFRIAKQIETGAVHINSMSVHDEPILPHGGAKKSGFGRFNGSQGLAEFLRTKTITYKE